MKLQQIQKEINNIAKCNMISGSLSLNVDIEASNYKEFEQQQNYILQNIVLPIGFDQTENVIDRKGLSIILFFNHIK